MPRMEKMARCSNYYLGIRPSGWCDYKQLNLDGEDTYIVEVEVETSDNPGPCCLLPRSQLSHSRPDCRHHNNNRGTDIYKGGKIAVLRPFATTTKRLEIN